MQEIQAALNKERKKRETFYNYITEQQKVEFINDEIVMHSPVKKSHNQATKFLCELPDPYVRKSKLGFAGVEEIMTALARNAYDRTAEATGYLLFRTRRSRYVFQHTD